LELHDDLVLKYNHSGKESMRS